MLFAIIFYGALVVAGLSIIALVFGLVRLIASRRSVAADARQSTMPSAANIIFWSIVGLSIALLTAFVSLSMACAGEC